MTSRSFAAALLVTLLWGVPLTAQDARLSARLAPDVAAHVEALVERARVDALPTEPLIQKALEGASRGAGPAVIVAAVEELADRLDVARDALGQRSEEAELVAAASALFVGVSPEELRSLRALAGGRSLALPLVVLADLADRGVPAATSAEVIRSMLEAGAPASGYTSLRQAVAEDIRSGATPAASASARTQGVLLQQPSFRDRPAPLPGRRPGGLRRPPRPGIR